MTSSARAEANRKNSGKSTGPRSDEGKARSSKNALKHGLTSQDAVLPTEDPDVFNDRLSQWVDAFRPTNPASLALVEGAFVASWRLERCRRAETERVAVKVRSAVLDYDLEKLKEAEELGQRLIFEPINRMQAPEIHDPYVRKQIDKRIADLPSVLSAQLQTFAVGVNWLIQTWTELAEMLRLHGYWHYPEKIRAIRLLGRNPEDIMEDQLVQRIFLACNIAHPDTNEQNADSFSWQNECIQAKLGLENKPMYALQVQKLGTLRPKNLVTARAILWEILTKEVTRLKALNETYLLPIADADRNAAPVIAGIDGTKEAVLLRRYETASQRDLQTSLASLGKLMKLDLEPTAETDSGPPAEVLRNEPIAEPVSERDVANNEPPAATPATAPDAPVGFAHHDVTARRGGSGVVSAPESAR